MRILPATAENIAKAAAMIKMGGLVIYPTETVYGLGCAPQLAEAAEKVCKAKGRSDRPLPLICSDMDVVKQLVQLNPAAETLAQRFWPGPLTLVLPSIEEFSAWVTRGSDTLALRIPDHPVSRELARLSGGVLVSTSANRTGEPPARTAQDAADSLGDSVNFILDDGESPGDKPSTILDITRGQAWILRTGPVTGQQIKDALGL